jgi:beta-carotene 3-hydroxylase
VNLLAAGVAFVAMEPVAYVAHRFVMHGPGMSWHRSHHRPRTGPVERNDRFPLVFGAATFLAMLAGALVPAVALLLPVGAGVSAYGFVYALVHDGYIHRRLPGFRWRAAPLDHLAEAHGLHHRFGGEPYGMLAPVVPAALRARAARPLSSRRQQSATAVGDQP